MSLIITDDLLEILTCNSCLRYLSVRPVKVYPNRKIMCGRCSHVGDSGVVSLFNLFADKCFFKCTNRFDGCRELLPYSEVPKHESVCFGKFYLCPICPVSTTTMPSFMMISHFQDIHVNMFLRVPYFSININAASDKFLFFLYRHQERLFFISFKVHSSTDYIEINNMLLGEHEDAENMRWRFIIDTQIYSEENPCDVYDSWINNHGIKMVKSGITKKNGNINVTIEINMVTAPAGGFVKLRTFEPSARAGGIHYDHFKLRYIHLNDRFLKTYPSYSVGDNLTSLMCTVRDATFELVLCCFNCNQMAYSVCENFTDDIFVVIMKEKFYLSCDHCTKAETGYCAPTDVIRKETLKSILFFCYWNCGSLFNIDSLRIHEMSCPLQPRQKCPVKYCDFTDKLIDIERHLIKVHPQLFPVFDEKRIGTITLELSIEKSSLKNFVIVGHEFILVKLDFNEPQWIVSISRRNQVREFRERSIAVAVIFDKYNNVIITLNEYRNVAICHMETIQVKCYFEKRPMSSHK